MLVICHWSQCAFLKLLLLFVLFLGIRDKLYLSSGCYNKNYCRLNRLNNKHLFLTILEAGKSKIKAPANFLSV